ncbi:MAG: phosphopyruvate hydratase [Candidatus Hadarchaeales archaeon]
MKLLSLNARKISDSRGNPTIEVEVLVSSAGKKFLGRAAAPSGASRGKYEVVDFPEGGVDAAIKKISKIEREMKKLKKLDISSVDTLLHEIDGTQNFSSIGGNTAVAISMAVAKALAAAKGIPLFKSLNQKAREFPFPLGNVLGGGKHAGKKAPDIQEFLVVSVGAKTVSEAIFTNSSVHKRVRKLIEQVDPTFTGGKGDEGAWAPNLGNREALEIVSRACEEISTETGITVRPGLDVAASSFYDEKSDKYIYKREGVEKTGGEQIDFIVDLVKTFKLVYVEDPLHEEDFDGFAELTRKIGDKCIVCGDDLLVTNVSRIKIGLEKKSVNAVLIKPNQIGTLSDTLEAVKLTKSHGCVPVISHRSGETTDETIAHLAVAWGCPMIKTGVVGGERIAKLNELIRIWEMIGGKAKMASLPIK